MLELQDVEMLLIVMGDDIVEDVEMAMKIVKDPKIATSRMPNLFMCNVTPKLYVCESEWHHHGLELGRWFVDEELCEMIVMIAPLQIGAS